MKNIYEVTLWSNGMLTVLSEEGSHSERFCNIWPTVYEKFREEGAACLFCIGDWHGGKVVCNPEALDRFYQDQLAPLSIRMGSK